MSMPLMSCGHTANAHGEGGKPVCVICFGFNPKAEREAIVAPDLAGRDMRCAYCGKSHSSNLNAAFFEYRPSLGTDSYYCGCQGWN